MREKGISSILAVFVVVAVITVGLAGTYSFKLFTLKSSTATASAQPTASPTPTNTPKLTFVPTNTPIQNIVPTRTPTSRVATSTPMATNTPVPSASCNYGINQATGAIQFTFVLSKGSSTYYSTVAEVKAENGCKVLDGNSTDMIQRFKTSSSSTLNISSVPSGSYNVRYSYNGSWGSSQNISVSSGQQSNVTFSIDNSTDP